MRGTPVYRADRALIYVQDLNGIGAISRCPSILGSGWLQLSLDGTLAVSTNVAHLITRGLAPR
jgi:predicted glycosyltransferase